MSELHRKASQLHAMGRWHDAERTYLAALAQDTDAADVLHDYALLLMQTNRPALAVDFFERAELARPSAETSLALAVCLRATHRLARGREVAAALVEQAPELAMAWMLKGSLDVISGAHSLAVKGLQRAVALDPGLDEAWHYLGEALQALQRWDEAMHAYRMSMRRQPGEIFNLALCCERSGRWQEALAGYARMHALYPSRIDAMVRLAYAQAMCCLFDEEARTISHIRQRLSDARAPLAPDDRPEMFPLTYLPLDHSLKAALMQRHARIISSRIPQSGQDSARAKPTHANQTRLRIGYLSPDFGRHPVGELVQGIFSAHDHQRVEIFGYSLRTHTGPIAERIRDSVEHFRDVATASNEDVAQRIRDDNLDVLIDLGGYTQGARPEVLAVRPAPVQLSWLGFIHGQQAPWLDALLLDAWTHPADSDWPYQDRVIHLPTVVFPGFPQTAGIRDRARFGLPEDAPILASFNTSYKLDARLIDAWVAILKRCTDARLLVCLPPHARDGFMHAWHRADGAPRVIIGDILPAPEQAARAASCDLFLDAFRYQAGATAMSALASGLPILTCTGAAPMARSTTSLNRYLGMDMLVTEHIGDYIDRAVELITTPGALAHLRSKLLQALSHTPLFDPRRSAADIEQVCFQLLQRKN